jgi:2-dehydrotetronate isomerase
LFFSTSMPAHTLQIAANLSWLYTEMPFLDRFEAAARDGFQGVECLFPHEHPAVEVSARLQSNGLPLVLFNAAPGDWAKGERGLACRLGREADFQRSTHEALSLAHRLQCPRIHVMAGLSDGLAQHDPKLHARELACYAQRMAWAAEQAEAAQVAIMIEPINPIDMLGYLLQTQADAHALVARIGSPHLQVQMDLYHCQRVEGDALALLEAYLPNGRVGHLQMAGVPGRHEPDVGELNDQGIFDALKRLRYSGWIGGEYRPQDATVGGTSRGLAWMKRVNCAA